MRYAQRLSQIEPFHVMRILAAAQQMQAAGRDVIHLEVGEPDFPTPQPIVEAGLNALAQGKTFYTGACGIWPLREAIAGFYQTRFGVTVDPARIIVTPGASGALQLILALLVDHGSEVLLTDPGYPCNRHLVSLLGGLPVNVPVGADTRFQLLAPHIEQYWHDNTAAALVASPANPTGTVLEPLEIKALAQACNARGGALIVDEIYQGLVYGRPHETALSLGEDLFVVNSFSKFFQMTGWRLGWLVSPPEHVAALEKLAQNLFLAPPTAAQWAALAAFAPATLELVEQRRQVLDGRRQYLQSALMQLGFGIPATPQGAFYLWADAGHLGRSAAHFCENLLATQAVAVTPGDDFGRQDNFLRFAYTQPTKTLEEACNRIHNYLISG
ncbi:aspartate/methionine/tyrosine aminotransferase [Silvimonas terrae]|uniref:Putative 8-amino-7-oxononanoate synthase n=1 Tax=Silvimonas terrae TaxID=300266 RepID=A0A840RKP0_9NEIS|nr:pyridoxal phosphate-dependent aminotransferase [Silvimonas terrae]MBB5192701.1 aspartate/methionine/tyrosine aminotransferase [Silvimonas terrae]